MDYGKMVFRLISAASLAVPAPCFAATQDDMSGLFALAGCGTILFIVVAAIVINILLLVWVARDSKARNYSSIVWLILVLLFGPVALIVYYFARPSGQIIKCDNCGNKKMASLAICPTCGQ